MATKMSDLVTAGHLAADIASGDYFYVTQGGSDHVLAATMKQVRKFLRPDFAPPLAASFPTAVNDGTPATITETLFGTVINGGAAEGGTGAQAFRGRFRSISGATWSAQARLRVTVNGVNFESGGLSVKYSGGSKIMSLGFRGGGTPGIELANLTSPTAYSASPVTVAWPPTIDWMKVAYDGTNLLWYISGDGVTWLNVYSNSPTSFLAAVPDMVGIGVNAIGGSSGETDLGVNILYYSDTGLAANY